MPRDHIVLKDRSGTNVTPLRLLRDASGRLAYQWELASPLPPDIPPQDVSYAEVPASQELVWFQNDWSGGALAFYYDPRDRAKYGIADKVWALTPNELSLGPSPQPLPFGVANGSAELNATTGWPGGDQSGIALSVVTTAPLAGIYHFQAASMSQNDYASTTLRDEGNVGSETTISSTWQGKSIVASAYVRLDSGSGNTVRMQIVESGGASTPTTNGSAVTLSTTYQRITVTVTLQSDTTGVELRIERTSSGGDITLFFDDVAAIGDRVSGGASANLYNSRMVVMNGKLYAPSGSALWRFDETSDYFYLIRVFGNDIRGLEIFDDRLVVGLGESTAYEYSDVQDDRTWTAASGAGNKANFFAKALNLNGNWALAKTLNDDEVYLTTDPTGTPSWGSAIDVGKDDHGVTNIYNIDGTIAIGKQDGFYQYMTLDGNRFQNRYPGAENLIDSNNFSRGLLHNGRFYTILGEVGLVEWDGEFWGVLSHIIRSPGFSDFGNRARGFGTDGQWLYLLVEDLSAASDSTLGWLLALENTEQGWRTHTVAGFLMNDCESMLLHNPTGETNKFLFLSGSSFGAGTPLAFRLLFPNRTDIPRLATNKRLALSGTLITSYWDGNRPQVSKAFNKLTLLTEDLSSVLTVTVAYQVDDDTAWTNINSSDATFNTSPSESISFNAGVTGRRIRLRFTLASDANTTSPVIKGFVLHTSWRPTRLKRWRVVAEIADNITTLQGVRQSLPAAKMLSQLTTLKDETSPIQLEDIDYTGTATDCHIIELAERQFEARQGVAGQVAYLRAVDIELMEANT